MAWQKYRGIRRSYLGCIQHFINDYVIKGLRLIQIIKL
jgi:hypothetical protein